MLSQLPEHDYRNICDVPDAVSDPDGRTPKIKFLSVPGPSTRFSRSCRYTTDGEHEEGSVRRVPA
jgi:hypothetical protein